MLPIGNTNPSTKILHVLLPQKRGPAWWNLQLCLILGTHHQCLQGNARHRCCFLKKISSISKAESSSPLDKGQQLSVVTVGQMNVNSRNNLNCYQVQNSFLLAITIIFPSSQRLLVRWNPKSQPTLTSTAGSSLPGNLLLVAEHKK